jgi:hypothetical protein
MRCLKSVAATALKAGQVTELSDSAQQAADTQAGCIARPPMLALLQWWWRIKRAISSTCRPADTNLKRQFNVHLLASFSIPKSVPHRHHEVQDHTAVKSYRCLASIWRLTNGRAGTGALAHLPVSNRLLLLQLLHVQLVALLPHTSISRCSLYLPLPLLLPH